MNNNKYPIIAHGEVYIEPISKKSSKMDKKYPREYEEARERVISDLKLLSASIEENSQNFLNEKVFCIRLEPKFEAKSYYPDVVTNVSEDMKIIGGRKYNYLEENEEKAKLYYVRVGKSGISKLLTTLEHDTKGNQKNWKEQIRSINSIDLMKPAEKALGFEENWTEGPVEFVLHPLGEEYQNEMVDRFFKISGLNRENASICSYKDGITFISAYANEENIKAATKYNPLRSAHPMGGIEIGQLRGMSVEGPLPPAEKSNTGVIIGAFDSGIDENNQYFNGFAVNYDMVENDIRDYSHGSGVCGALLYGNIDDPSTSSRLKTPDSFVEMFRVFPEDGTYSDDSFKKIGLYETIDKIEAVVKERRDIKLFNLSLGPRMPVIDDEISRFTYALDYLTYDVNEDEKNPLFAVAVGNDGEEDEPFNRIQPPADMVNGLSVGAYTYNPLNEKICASYSCIGPGREGAKVKPDILEFGGSKTRPFVSTSKNDKQVELYAGTSFAAPLALHKIGNMIAQSKELSPHMGRTLIIHAAEQGNKEARNIESGYGYSTKSADEILHCEDNIVTVLYEGSLDPGTTAKLPIYAPFINEVSGNVKITWTITTIVSPENNDSDAYTNNCIEDTFYPHSQKYTFTKNRKKISLDLSKPENVALQNELLNEGYSKSFMPDSKSGKTYKDESELRNTDLKWDTVIKKHQSMRGYSVFDPFLTVHAMSRNGFENKPIKYYIAITIEAPKYKGSLYNGILRTYSRLEPIQVRNITRVKV